MNDGLTAVLDTVAHEVGHVILGVGHPDKYDATDPSAGGVAPLIDTDPIPRLMCSGDIRPSDGFSRILVKKEWDQSEVWFKGEQDGGKLNEEFFCNPCDFSAFAL